MFIDARQVPESTMLEAELCIIGSGAAGITIATEFSDRRCRVILLESGGFDMDKASQSLYEGKNIGLPYEDLHKIRSRFFGGSTNCWGGWCRPFDNIDFEKRDWIPYSGWPFPRAALEPYYERATEICGVGPNNYEPAFWADTVAEHGLQVLDLPKDRVVTRITQLSKDRKFGQAHRAGLEKASNIQIYLHANVLELQTDDEAKTVTDVRVGTFEGNSFCVSAKVFILATGGIENPRLLLLSNKVRTAGLGNQHDLVGRFFMENPRIDMGEIELGSPKVSTELYDAMYNYFFQSPIAANLALNEETQRKEQTLNYRGWIFSVCQGEESRGGEALKNLYRAVKKPTMRDHFTDTSLAFWGRNIVNTLTDPVNTAAVISGRLFRSLRSIKRRQLVHICEPAPNPDSRVTLSHRKDRLGLNRVDVDWRMGLLEKRTIRRAQEIIAQELERSGLGRVNGDSLDDTRADWSPNLQWVWHHMGTTRMHNDPRQGVVDENCRVHGMSNLFIAGSSVFPTGGSDMPTMTIVALALRLGEHVNALLGDRKI
jgi:choline dehydrogenase-like flavoprotein